MTSNKHLAIFAPNLAMSSPFIQNLLKGNPPHGFENFNQEKGVLFSTYTLNKYIKEEALHDDNTLTKSEGRSLRTFSSGEQRKALLNYLLSTKPDFLLLDNIFDMIDVESRSDLLAQFEMLAKELTIIQLVKRKDNLLPFIQNAICIENESVVYSGTIEEYFNLYDNKNSIELLGELPTTLNELSAQNNPLVAFNKVSVKYDKRTIVKDINWTINTGDFWQLKGPNGSGKTTLLSMITGDNPKAYGQDITLFGNKRGSGESIWDIKKKIGYVTPSMISLFRGWNTVEKMVVSGLVDSIGLYKKPSEMQKRVAQQWLKLIGLHDKKHTRFSTLNEGLKCMVLIVRAMIKHPTLLILDEPSHGLNDYHALLLSALINKIASEGHTTIIYVSHRNEPGLKPKQIFKLLPSQLGSTGIVEE